MEIWGCMGTCRTFRDMGVHLPDGLRIFGFQQVYAFRILQLQGLSVLLTRYEASSCLAKAFETINP